MPKIAFRNFTGGEISPTMCARYDLNKFGTFMQCCRNMIPNLHGDIERRPGTKFLADLGSNSFLLPFSYSTAAVNNFVLVFQSSGAIKVIDLNGTVAATMVNPYSISDMPDVSYAQTGNKMYLAHPSYPLKKITWTYDEDEDVYVWSIADVSINTSLGAPSKPSLSIHRGSDNYSKNENSTLRYKVACVDANGVESLPSEAGTVTFRFPSDWVEGDFVDITWTGIAGASEYNIYRESGGYFGLIGVKQASDGTSGGTVSTVKSGAETAAALLFAGARNIVVDNYRTYDKRDSDSGLVISASSSQKAFYFASIDKTFVYVTQTTTTYGSTEKYDDSSGTYVTSQTTTTTTSKFWVVVSGQAAAGSYGTAYTVMSSLGTNASYPSGSWQTLTIIPVYANGGTFTFRDENYTPDMNTTPRVDWNPFSDADDKVKNQRNPATVCFHQQRLALAGTTASPATFYMSRTGDFENFRKSEPVMDDDPCEYMLASGSIDDIKWLVSFGDLIIGTAGAEYQAKGDNGAITPEGIQVSTDSFWGSRALHPLIIGQSILHCQRSGSHVRDLYYNWESDGYAGNDLSIFAPELVEASPIKQWCFQQSPGNNVWAVRRDGLLLCLTYLKEQKVYAWSRHVTHDRYVSGSTSPLNDRVQSICCISGGEEDVVIMVVARTVNGSTKYYLEKLMPRFADTDAIANAWFADCAVVKTPTEDESGSQVVVSGLGHLEGLEVCVLADGAPETHTVSGGTITLNYPASKALVGLQSTAVMAPMPVETDAQSGTTLSSRRAYGKCTLRLYRSVGGKYAATQTGNLWDKMAWTTAEQYDIPFLPDSWGVACQPYSGDIDITIPSGQDVDTSLWLIQDRPLPFRVIAITVNIDFGEQ